MQCFQLMNFVLITWWTLFFSNSAACSSAVRKPAISLADSTDLRVLLNIMYLMVETIQQDDPADKPEWKIIRETFRAELGKLYMRSYGIRSRYQAEVTFCLIIQTFRLQLRPFCMCSQIGYLSST